MLPAHPSEIRLAFHRTGSAGHPEANNQKTKKQKHVGDILSIHEKARGVVQ